MKGISPLVAFVLVIAISVAAISIALSIGNPAIEKSKEILILDEGKENLKIMDNSINQVLQEGDGSSRKISLSVTGGNYKVYDNKVEFTMTTNHQIMSEEASGLKDGIYYDVTQGEITAYIEYLFNFIGEKELVKGANSIVISNQGGQIKIV